MRSVGCGLLLLGLWMLPALGQAPGAAPRPSLDEARNAARCDGTRWEKMIADIKAADPERDAEKQIAQGNYTLRSARVLIETFISPGLNISADVVLGERLPGVQCHLDMRPTETFPIQGYVEAFPIQVYVEDASTGMDKWCVRAALELAEQYAKRFNGRVVRDPAYPHNDLCTAGPGSDVSAKDATAGSAKDATAGFAALPTPDLVQHRFPTLPPPPASDSPNMSRSSSPTAPT